MLLQSSTNEPPVAGTRIGASSGRALGLSAAGDPSAEQLVVMRIGDRISRAELSQFGVIG